MSLFEFCPAEVQGGSRKDDDDEDEDLKDVVLPTVAAELASMVAISGDGLEEIARSRNADEDQLA